MPKPQINDKIMPFGEHLEDLRRRLILALVGIVPIFIVGTLVAGRILQLILDPVVRALGNEGQPQHMMITAPLEGFYAWFRVVLVFTLVVGAPWIIYQLWMFVAPGLYRSEQRFARMLAPLSVVLTVLGVLFMYYVLLPVMLIFFVRFAAAIAPVRVATAPPPPGTVFPMIPVLAADPVDPQPGQVWVNLDLHQMRICVPAPERASTLAERIGLSSIRPHASGESVPAEGAASTDDEAPPPGPVVVGTPLLGGALLMQQYRLSEWVGLFLQLMLAIAVAFQAPIVILLLGWAGIVKPAFLVKYRRHAIFINVIIGAVVTPADPISMILLTVPLLLLYEFGLLLLRCFPAKRVAGEDELSEASRDAEETEAAERAEEPESQDAPMVNDDVADVPGGDGGAGESEGGIR